MDRAFGELYDPALSEFQMMNGETDCEAGSAALSEKQFFFRRRSALYCSKACLGGCFAILPRRVEALPCGFFLHFPEIDRGLRLIFSIAQQV